MYAYLLVVLYCIVLIFAGLNFCEFLFLTILLKKFRKYAVETGDGMKYQNFGEIFSQMALNSQKSQKFRPVKYKCYIWYTTMTHFMYTI